MSSVNAEPLADDTRVDIPIAGKGDDRKGDSELLSRLEQATLDARESRLRYQEFFEFSPNGYVVTDHLGVILEANQAAAALLGRGKAFLVDKPLACFLDRESMLAFYQQLARPDAPEREPFSREVRLKCHHDGCRDVLLSATPLCQPEGRSPRFRWLLRDVSQVRLAEQALRSQKHFADSLVEAAEAMILVVNPHGRILRSNPYLQNVSGYEAPDLLDCDWSDLLLEPGERPAARELLGTALRTGSARNDNLTLLTRDGRRRSITWLARVFGAGPEKAVALLGHDTTDLREARDQALRVERLAAVGQTITALAHESRNALQRVQACVSLLNLRLQGQPEALDLLGRLQQARDDLSCLYENVRTFATPVQLDRRLCDVREVWRQAWDDLAAARADKRAELREEVGDVNTWCPADPFHLRQVFRNLLENALSAAAESATITVRCSEADTPGRPALRIAVRDDGPGFTEEQRRRAFEPFFTTKHRGTGLGLAICRHVVEAHGGRIALGDPNVPGAEVIVTLPRSAS
jgi:PAS domain S-box-containing protein